MLDQETKIKSNKSFKISHSQSFKISHSQSSEIKNHAIMINKQVQEYKIIKPLKRNAIKITNKEEIIDPRSIPKNPLFQTSDIRFIKFSIIMLLFYVYFINLSKIMSYLAALSFIK